MSLLRACRRRRGEEVDQGIVRHGVGQRSDCAGHLQNRLGSGVYHEKTLAARDRITDTVYFRKAFEPAGMPQVIGMTARLSVGEAIFAFGFHAPGARGFVSGETEAILQLLLPSFEAGFHAIDRRNRHRERLEKAIRASALPAHLLDSRDPADPDALLQLPLPEIGDDGARCRISGSDRSARPGSRSPSRNASV